MTLSPRQDQPIGTGQTLFEMHTPKQTASDSLHPPVAFRGSTGGESRGLFVSMKSEITKRPAFQFYPADWRKDVALQSCSLAARGLWIDLICLAHESEIYGFLIINGSKMDEKAIAKLVGETRAKTSRLLQELEGKGVFSRDENGVIFSRRMVKDEHIRTVRAGAGKLGGNPLLVADKVKQKTRKEGDLLNLGDKQVPTPSSSSSSSSSPSGEEKSARTPKESPPAEEPSDDWSDQMPTETARDFAKLEAWINSLHPSWKKRPHLTRIEREELMANSKIFFDLTDRDKDLLARYMDAAIEESWGKFWQPDHRGQLVRSVMDVLSHADRWERECRKRKVPTGLEVVGGAA
jgi:hypothetical protein